MYIVRPFDDESILLLSPPSLRSNLMFRCALRKIDNIDDDEVMDDDDSRIKNRKQKKKKKKNKEQTNTLTQMKQMKN